MQKGLKAGGDIFTENLGNVRRVGQATVEMFLNITRAAKPFVKDFSDFMARWFGRAGGAHAQHQGDAQGHRQHGR